MQLFKTLSAKARLAVVVGATLAGGALVVPAAYASTVSGATAPSVAAVAAAPAANVATQCNIVPHRFAVYGPRCSNRKGYLCFVGNSERFRTFPRFASNGCQTDVDMFPTRGAPLCVRHGSATGDLRTNYVSFRVLSTRGC